ncbi:ABC transporter ATP-binding protein [Amycolatopsis sp. NPDC005232]|uniref:ABC transporter ATP-binding protein n=1 Tax=Amycolatopsis sp. NPDC005232 TaxID=3157027 RepID=UPI0033A9FFD6
MLRVSDLHVSYGRVPAVRGISVTVEPGSITLVLGANGAGKTTTLRSIAGLHPPDSGEITMQGRRIERQRADRVVAAGIVLVPEGRRVFGPLTVEENLRLGGYTRPRAGLIEELERVYDLFPVLSERRHGAAGLLSGGEQQMLAFGRALMARPKVLLIDEPSLGLAPAIVNTVLTRVREVADSGIGVLMVEQNAKVALEIADDAVVVARGEVVFSGSAQETRSHSSVVRAFLGETALRQES